VAAGRPQNCHAGRDIPERDARVGPRPYSEACDRPTRLSSPAPESAEWFSGLSPLRRQLLGAAATPEGHWLPADADVPLRARMRERGFPPESLR